MQYDTQHFCYRLFSGEILLSMRRHWVIEVAERNVCMEDPKTQTHNCLTLTWWTVCETHVLLSHCYICYICNISCTFNKYIHISYMQFMDYSKTQIVHVVGQFPRPFVEWHMWSVLCNTTTQNILLYDFKRHQRETRTLQKTWPKLACLMSMIFICIFHPV